MIAGFSPLSETDEFAHQQGGAGCGRSNLLFVVCFSNTTDYDSNYRFVRHVMLMDSTFPSN
jgi:hypothetical protein